MSNNELGNSSFLADNHAAHHVADVMDLIYNSGAIVRFLSPYSPDLNPIEEVFAKVKYYLRQNDLILQSVKDASPLIWHAFGQITSDDCMGCYAPCRIRIDVVL